VAPRLLLIGAATAVIVTVSVLVTVLSFTPQQWLPFIAGNVLVA
jgi:type IV secretory pathway TrbD component